jgi:hypothetical protein
MSMEVAPQDAGSTSAIDSENRRPGLVGDTPCCTSGENVRPLLTV